MCSPRSGLLYIVNGFLTAVNTHTYTLYIYTIIHSFLLALYYNGVYYLNGNQRVSIEKSILIAGTTFSYLRDSDTNHETLTADGPLDSEVEIRVRML